MIMSFNEFCEKNKVDRMENFWKFVCHDHSDRKGNIIWCGQPFDRDYPFCDEQAYKSIHEEFEMSCCGYDDVVPLSQEGIDSLLTEMISD